MGAEWKGAGKDDPHISGFQQDANTRRPGSGFILIPPGTRFQWQPPEGGTFFLQSPDLQGGSQKWMCPARGAGVSELFERSRRLRTTGLGCSTGSVSVG